MGSRTEIRFVPAPGRDHVDQRRVNSIIEGLNVNHWTPLDRTTRENCAHMRYVHRLLQLDEEGEEIEDELHVPVLRVHARVTVFPSLRESPITNEAVQQMFEHHRHLHEHGIPAYHPSAPPHVPQSDDDDDEEEDETEGEDLRPSEHEHLSDEEYTPALDETFQLDDPFPVIDIRPVLTGM